MSIVSTLDIFRRSWFGIAVSACLAIVACHRAAPPSDDGASHYEARGIIRGIAADQNTIDVEHEDIRGFMPSMTMPFRVHDKKEIAELRLGDGISFRLNVSDQEVWIDKVKKISASGLHLPTPTASVSARVSARLREGDQMPDFKLTNQNGEPLSRETLHGRPFVLTFIFTRCPVPNFCPRMSNNFEELQTAIKAAKDPLAQTLLLSVTLDPGFDTPKILKDYGASHQADPQIWTFATGDEKQIDVLTQAFSVYRQTESGTISHGLATALISKEGNIEKIWRGNAWTPAEVIDEIKRVESK